MLPKRAATQEASEAPPAVRRSSHTPTLSKKVRFEEPSLIAKYV
jgi:hypothetical protein